MKGVFRVLVWSALLLFPAVGRAAENWTQLKRGMTADETVAALGKPLLSSEGFGFAVWIYDHGTEVVFFDRVIAWTAPHAGNAAGPKPVAWGFFQGSPGQMREPVTTRRPARAAAAPLILPPAEYSSFRFQPRR
jgi:hypothetical protein